MPAHALRQVAMSNAERQRKFRAANPGYFNKYNNRRKASRIAAQKKALILFNELAKARMAAMASTTTAAPAIPLTQTTPPPTPAKPMLMLPAPVQDPMVAELDALRASLKARASGASEPLPVHTPRAVRPDAA